jgi:hypothetical protein
MGRKQCSFCDSKQADRMVSDEIDFYPCCEACERAWALDPGCQRNEKSFAKKPTPAADREG